MAQANRFAILTRAQTVKSRPPYPRTRQYGTWYGIRAPAKNNFTSCLSYGPPTALHPPTRTRYAQADVPCRQTIIRRNRVELFVAVTLKEKVMTYYFSKTIRLGFDEAVSRITQALKEEGFGILTEIDVKSTLKKKLDVDFRKYHILGACNPPFAYKALQAEDKVGTMLPCNVIVQETADGEVEIAAIDPIASMKAIDNPGLREIAETMSQKLKNIVENV
jgi:uncharacterized protein (DUF302 family)